MRPSIKQISGGLEYEEGASGGNYKEPFCDLSDNGMGLLARRGALQQISHFIEQSHLLGMELKFSHQAIERFGMVAGLRRSLHLFRYIFINCVGAVVLAIQGNADRV